MSTLRSLLVRVRQGVCYVVVDPVAGQDANLMVEGRQESVDDSGECLQNLVVQVRQGSI